MRTPSPLLEELRRVFSQVDVDNNGYIVLCELASFFRDIGQQLTDNQTRDLAADSHDGCAHGADDLGVHVRR